MTIDQIKVDYVSEVLKDFVDDAFSHYNRIFEAQIFTEEEKQEVICAMASTFIKENLKMVINNFNSKTYNIFIDKLRKDLLGEVNDSNSTDNK